jgi:hypothetical protein
LGHLTVAKGRFIWVKTCGVIVAWVVDSGTHRDDGYVFVAVGSKQRPHALRLLYLGVKPEVIIFGLQDHGHAGALSGGAGLTFAEQ